MSKIIGYTSGVFDLFHIGHLNLLKKAKENCDYLIVGVTTDELSKNEKKKVPVIPFNERFTIVSALNFVDEVIPQSSYDKFEAWENVKFDRMFVGDDWKGTEKWNLIEKEFEKFNVEIIYFPYTKTTSSTLLRSVLENKVLEIPLS